MAFVITKKELADWIRCKIVRLKFYAKIFLEKRKDFIEKIKIIRVFDLNFWAIELFSHIEHFWDDFKHPISSQFYGFRVERKVFESNLNFLFQSSSVMTIFEFLILSRISSQISPFWAEFPFWSEISLFWYLFEPKRMIWG